MTRDRLKKILADFSGKRILVVGDVMLDQHVYGRVERLNPEAPVPVLHAREAGNRTGGAGNVAKNLVSLGGKASLVGVVGVDDTAKELEIAADEEGYAAHLIADASRPTTRKMRFMVNAQQLLRVDWEETPDISADIADQLIERVTQQAAEGIDALIVSDYAKGTITQKVAEALLSLAQEYSIPIAADVKPSRVAYFKGATLIAPNLKEAHEYLGLNHLAQGGKDVADLAHALQEKFATDVFVTMSAGGVYVLTLDGVEQHVPQEHVIEVADTSGAGDTSLAAMMLARLADATPVEMAEIANAAGAVVVSKVGVVAVTQEEIEHMMLHQHEQRGHD